jgi:hypothetical protein
MSATLLPVDPSARATRKSGCFPPRLCTARPRLDPGRDALDHRSFQGRISARIGAAIFVVSYLLASAVLADLYLSVVPQIVLHGLR